MDTDDAFTFEPGADDDAGNDDLLLHELNDIGLALRVQALRELNLQ